MDKSPEAFRTISEVADALDVPPHVLRFWESRFTQIKPVKRGGGRRYYRPEDVSLLRGIRGLLYDDGMTIKGVQKILRERGVRHVIGLGSASGADEDAAIVPTPATTPRKAAVRKTERTSAAPKPRPVAPAPEPRAEPQPQPDLFGAEPGTSTGADVTASIPKPRAPAPAPASGGATDPKAALRALVAELQALREVMVAEPKR